MSKTLEAVYENGVLRPLQPLHLQEHQRVRLTMDDIDPRLADIDDLIDYDFINFATANAIEVPSIEVVRKALSTIPGNMTHAFQEERDAR